MSISREARERSLERERFPEGSAASARAEPAREREQAEPRTSQIDTLAVRFGPAPLDKLEPRGPDEIEAAALRERARIRGVGAVLDPPRDEPAPDPRAQRREAAREAARAEAALDPMAPMPGSEEDEKLEFPPLLGSERVAGEAPEMSGLPPRVQLPRPEPELELRGLRRPDREVERSEQDVAIAQALGAPGDSPAAREDLRDEAPKLAPAAAPVARPGGEPRPELPTERVEPLGRGVAERAFTKAGAVAAQAADELVTRFLAKTPVADPGPEPRAKIDRISERG